jgi:isoprenylcysteine carboxyl methyltransferase (ICMT) family protein YpbQ
MLSYLQCVVEISLQSHIKNVLQDDVQKDGGKSFDLANYPYMFMVRITFYLNLSLDSS